MTTCSRAGRLLALALLLGGCSEPWDLGFWQRSLEAYCSVTVDGRGIKAVETDYLPHVVACENGAARLEALKAQAVTARTFMHYKINSSGSIGDGTGDQVYTCTNKPGVQHYEAVAATAGQVLRYSGVVICSFYVAGARPSLTSCVAQSTDPDSSPATERYVTYNEGRTGTAVIQTTLGWVNPGNLYNRGCKSQNGANCLAEQGRLYPDILRFYYGADIELVSTEGDCIIPQPLPDAGAPDSPVDGPFIGQDGGWLPGQEGGGPAWPEASTVSDGSAFIPVEPVGPSFQPALRGGCAVDSAAPYSPPDGWGWLALALALIGRCCYRNISNRCRRRPTSISTLAPPPPRPSGRPPRFSFWGFFISLAPRCCFALRLPRMWIRLGGVVLCLAVTGLWGCQRSNVDPSPGFSAETLASASAVLLERRAGAWPAGRLRISDPAAIRRLAAALDPRPAEACGCMASHFLTFFLPDGRKAEVAFAAETWMIISDKAPAASWQDRSGRLRGELDRLLGSSPPEGLVEALSAQLGCRLSAIGFFEGGMFSGLCETEQGAATAAFVCHHNGRRWTCRKQ